MQLNLLVIYSNQPKIIADWYQSLGIDFIYHQHGKGSWHYSAKVQGIVFEIYPLTSTQKTPTTAIRLGFNVEHLDVLIQELVIRGTLISQSPQLKSWGYTAVVLDPDGRKVELTQN